MCSSRTNVLIMNTIIEHWIFCNESEDKQTVDPFEELCELVSLSPDHCESEIDQGISFMFSIS